MRGVGGAVPFRNRQLEYFVTVAEEGQITRAASKLHIAQPALSQAIAQLEAEMGVKLLERQPRGVTLTAAGEIFYPKARAVLEREQEAADAARSLQRAARGTLTIGFVGPPPTLSVPALLDTFAAAHPEVGISLKDMVFPCGTTAAWLENVDVAICHPPAMEDSVRVQSVRVEPRAVVVHGEHRLAGLEQVGVADVLDETFVSYHPDVQPQWAGFHSLDDERGGPPTQLTDDRVISSMQMFSAMSHSRAVTTVPECDARLVEQVLPMLAIIPLRDVPPAVLSLAWNAGNTHPALPALIAAAAHMYSVNGSAGRGGPSPVP